MQFGSTTELNAEAATAAVRGTLLARHQLRAAGEHLLLFLRRKRAHIRLCQLHTILAGLPGAGHRHSGRRLQHIKLLVPGSGLPDFKRNRAGSICQHDFKIRFSVFGGTGGLLGHLCQQSTLHRGVCSLGIQLCSATELHGFGRLRD